MNGTVYTPSGPANFTSTYYNPGAATAAQAAAGAENDAMITNTIETGRRNLAMLERTVLKDNTIIPGGKGGGGGGVGGGRGRRGRGEGGEERGGGGGKGG